MLAENKRICEESRMENETTRESGADYALKTRGKMRVLVACEFSGVVREAFRRLGHEAVSCDLLATEIPGPHVVGDALEVLGRETWDLVVAHPPCTYLCNSGVRWLFGGCGSLRDEARFAAMREGAEFFRAFFARHEGALCVENPIMHGHAAALVGEPAGVVRQMVQPWQFGHMESKATYLWLRGLPASWCMNRRRRTIQSNQTERIPSPRASA